jgi:hypothetical protein
VALTLGQPVVAECDCEVDQVSQTLGTPTATLVPAPVEDGPTIEESPVSEPSPGVESPELTPSDVPIVSWQDAAAYEGQMVTVEGQVIDTYNSGNVVFLNFDEDFRTTFKVAIFPDAWPLFPEPPEDYYQHRRIQVTGQVKIYQNAPEVIVDRPDQIEIIE